MTAQPSLFATRPKRRPRQRRRRPPSNPIPLFAEGCAGLAPLSLALQGGDAARPPCSRMGNKWAYRTGILRRFGLRAGQGARFFVWCEPDDGARALLMAYCAPDVLWEAADIIRGWAAEEPRSLWERLKAEGPIRGADGGEVARHVLLGQWAYRSGLPESGLNGARLRGSETTATSNGWAARTAESEAEQVASRLPLPSMPALITSDARQVEPSEISRLLRLWTANRLINIDAHTWTNNGQGGSTHGGPEFCTPIQSLAEACEQVEGVPRALIVSDGRTLDPAEVARFVVAQGWTNGGNTWESCGRFGGDRIVSPSGAVHVPVTPEGFAGRLDSITSIPGPGPGGDAPVGDTLPPGSIAYFDPPYLNTTGYAHDLSREEVCTMAERWAGAGAFVGISEAEPVGELVAEGWHVAEITEERQGGGARTFSRQKREFLTMNQEPRYVAPRRPVQHSLLGAGL